MGSNTGATTDMSGSRTAVATHSTKFSNFSKSDDTEVGPMVQEELVNTISACGSTS